MTTVVCEFASFSVESDVALPKDVCFLSSPLGVNNYSNDRIPKKSPMAVIKGGCFSCICAALAWPGLLPGVF